MESTEVENPFPLFFEETGLITYEQDRPIIACFYSLKVQNVFIGPRDTRIAIFLPADHPLLADQATQARLRSRFGEIWFVPIEKYDIYFSTRRIDPYVDYAWAKR